MSADALRERLDATLAAATAGLRGPAEPHDDDVYAVASLSASVGAARRIADAVTDDTSALAADQFAARVAAETIGEFAGRWDRLGVPDEARLTGAEKAIGDLLSPDAVGRLGQSVVAAAAAGAGGFAGLPDDIAEFGRVVRSFVDSEVLPVAQEVHRRDLDVPERIIEGLARLGCFAFSVPDAYGGARAGDSLDHLLLVAVATEELSRGSLGVAGSLITRPEILIQVLLTGGTEEQRATVLPKVAAGELLSAVAVTEPGHGSDVAGLRLTARRVPGGWRLDGVKTWCTFAGLADMLLVLARTDPDPAARHRGLSMFLVPKQRVAGREFDLSQPGGGRLRGRAIATLGYRGMHSYEISFEEWIVPDDALVGGEAGLGRGFYLQMGGFEVARVQTAARATGVMQGALAEAARYAGERSVFGSPVGDLPLSRATFARMGTQVAAARAFTRAVARDLSRAPDKQAAAQVKLYACRVAEQVTRDALQLHGAYGYAEEYPVSRLFVDARVLSIFEGTNEVLALKVIGPWLRGR